MRLRILMVATAAVVALAGCSNHSGTNTTAGTGAKPAAGAPTSAAAAGGVDPCTLITTAQASTVLGEQAKDGQPHSFQSTKQCQWDSANGSVAILIWVGGKETVWQTSHDAAKAAPKFQDISGLGDAAFTTGFDVHVLKGDDVYQIGVSGVTNPLGSATTVAKEALAKV